ncbi:MAG: DEAD/DEAH box helicase [Patescibacteria group bacterium]
MTFSDLNLISPLMDAIKSEKYFEPTPIQSKSIPVILDQKDLLGCAQTGTGKTAAFAIPILQLLHNDQKNQKKSSYRRNIRALIITPTRELAIQISENFSSYGKYLHLRHGVIYGGVSQFHQTKMLRAGVDILIATPGRLLDLINQRYIDLSFVKIFTLDEADRLLDMGFIHDIKKVINYLPPHRQNLFFCATMPSAIDDLSKTILVNPVKVAVNPVSSTATTVQQSMYYVEKSKKRSLLIDVIKENNIASALVFTRTKFGADRVVRYLYQAGISAEAIHGNKSQNARQRALQNFKNKRTKILVATDIAARGLDIESLSHVINYDIPNLPETYVHRIGRTGRAGAAGIALSFCDQEEKKYLRDINYLIKQTIPVIEEHPYPITSADSSPRQSSRRRSSSKNQHSRNSFPRNRQSRWSKPNFRRQKSY